MGLFLKHVAHYHPEHVISNEMLQEICGADPSWILSRTGIQTRRHMADYQGEFPGLEIVTRCLRNWKEKYPGAIARSRMIISASTHDDIHYPNAGNFVAEEEGLSVPVFQIKTACTSVVYAIFLARSFLSTTVDGDILILNGEAFTRYVDYGDRKSCILFGDAASVLMVSPQNGEFEIIDVEVGGKGLKIVQATRTSETSHLSVNEMTSGALTPGKPLQNRRRSSDKKFQQDGKAVFDFVLNEMPGKVSTFLEKNGLKTGDIHHVILHQSNLIMMEMLLEKLGLDRGKHSYNVDRFGNTSSAGWVTVLSQLQDKIPKNAVILVTAFGAGMTWGNLLLRKS